MRTASLPGQLFLHPAVEVVPEPDELRSSFRTGQGDVLAPFQARLVLAVHHQEALLGLDQADVDPRRGGEDVGTGRGLEGDRYCLGNGTFSPQPQKPDYEVTLIELEKIEAFCRESGLPFTSSRARRNIVTQGVDLNSLVGKTFRIGEVLIRGIRLCEPCNHLAKTSFPEALSGLAHKAGLRAQIMSEGIIHVGDAIVEQ